MRPIMLVFNAPNRSGTGNAGNVAVRWERRGPDRTAGHGQCASGIRCSDAVLASVAGAAEAEIALRGGADVIDLKGPSGGFDAIPLQAIRDAVTQVAGRRSTSAMADDPAVPASVCAAVAAIAVAGVDYVRLAMPRGGDAPATVRALSALAATTKLIAVLFAETAPDLSVLPMLAQAGFAGAMLDTRDRSRGGLLDHMDPLAVRGFVDRCRELGLIAGLAGSLETPDIPRLLVLAPDLLGFDNALRDPAGASGLVDLDRVRQVRALIPVRNEAATSSRVHAGLPTPRGDATDLVFVHDFILPVSIGAYSRERDARQRVRFDVEVAVTRAERAAADMRDVFSYDVITDAIRLLVGAGHVAFVETLAERIAAAVLAEPRATRVSVRVQKLETGSGAAGVLIERTRESAGEEASEIAPPVGPSAA